MAGPVSHPLLTEECIGQEELVLVTAAAWGPLETWLSGSSELKMLVLRTGCSYRQRLETILAQRGIVNVRCMEFGMLDAIMGCVRAGIGITLLPRSVVSTHRFGGSLALHKLLPAESYVETVFIRRTGAFASVALNGFLNCLREHAARTDWRLRDTLTS
ncbi:MAG TPA: LysR substrate-binding domain-containing protein [Chloroflexota bacterium]|nr:LysR substrate-binding domain-containing protein [Chloroflexota bacterium]